VVRMFQNIEEKEENEIVEETTVIDKKEKIKQILKKLFTMQNILMYIISFMLSTVSSINEMAPFGLAIFAGALSNALPVRNNISSNAYRNNYKIWRKWSTNIYINKSSIYCNGFNL